MPGDDYDHNLLLQKKARYFKDNSKRVHINYKDSERDWKRGYIEDIRADFFLLWEDHERKHIPVFYVELTQDSINEYIPKEEADKSKKEAQKKEVSINGNL